MGEDSERYYLDLQRQAEERHRSRAREKEEDRRLAQQVLNEPHLLQRIVVAGVRAYMLGVLQSLSLCINSCVPGYPLNSATESSAVGESS